MKFEYPYQIVTFLTREPQVGESVYYGENGWYPQLALKRRFKLNLIDEAAIVARLKAFFPKYQNITIATGKLIKPKNMPVRVIEMSNRSDLEVVHYELLNLLGSTIISRYPDRDGNNYVPHITAEYDNEFVIPVEEYTNKTFALHNVWILKDVGDENSQAYIKIL